MSLISAGSISLDSAFNIYKQPTFYFLGIRAWCQVPLYRRDTYLINRYRYSTSKTLRKPREDPSKEQQKESQKYERVSRCRDPCECRILSPAEQSFRCCSARGCCRFSCCSHPSPSATTQGTYASNFN